VSLDGPEIAGEGTQYFCEYCDVYLTHDSAAVRKQHNDGNRHRMNVAEYYKQFIGADMQRRIDRVVAQFEAKVAAGLVVPTYGFADTPVRVMSVTETPLVTTIGSYPADMETSRAI